MLGDQTTRPEDPDNSDGTDTGPDRGDGPHRNGAHRNETPLHDAQGNSTRTDDPEIDDAGVDRALSQLSQAELDYVVGGGFSARILRGRRVLSPAEINPFLDDPTD